MDNAPDFYQDYREIDFAQLHFDNKLAKIISVLTPSTVLVSFQTHWQK